MSPLIPSEKKSKFNLNKIKNSLRSLPAWLVVGPFCLSALLAILWALTVSLRTNQDFFTRGAFAIQIPPYIKNYFLAWTQMRVGRYFLNSVFYSVVGTLGAILLAAMISYVLSRVEFKMAKPIYVFFLFLMMWPGWVSLLPSYMWMRALGLIDTYLVLFLGYWLGSLPFNCFLLFSFFETLPKELEEAALIDGANAWQIFWKVMFPLARPGVITIGIFSFINIWNDFFSPLIYLRNPDKYPLALGIQLLSVSSTYAADHPRLFAGMLIFLVPILVIYFLMRDRITEGLTVGAIKG
ncbi:putative Binding-protein-dependent transport systems inner membrane component [Brevefilum fermentans]|jgi:N-acetylglucosamine transport system permease protein|uniref:Putative Binding-protein-dependent transport systems inner membrane component n=1 Tax=Candidatus Brevifilum fermentans TaxID=1986204 RepID=A0A1Y6K0K4_9CHLR|nr:putative Binding-protein-dependent transport systems inner membrane component [Brevefilum fermentans]